MSNFIGDFDELHPPVFKKRTHDFCVSFAMENYEVLEKTVGRNRYKTDKFYTLDEQLKNNIQPKGRTAKKSGPPKKKKIPVVLDDDEAKNEPEQDEAEAEPEKPEEKGSEEEKKNK